MALKSINLNENCLSFALRRASRAVGQIFDRQLAPLNLRSTQLNLLIGLHEKKNKSLTEIAAHLVMDRTTLTRNLKPLEKAGFIAMQQLSDKRQRSYILTDKGLKIVAQAQPFWESHQEQLSEVFERAFLTNLIEQLNYVIQKCRQIV